MRNIFQALKDYLAIKRKKQIYGCDLWCWQIPLMICSILLTVIILSTIDRIFRVAIFDKPVTLFALITGYILNFIRVFIKDLFNWYHNRIKKIKRKHLLDLFPSFFLNYPVFLASAYYITYGFKDNLFVIPFIVGWSVDYLWSEGNIFAGLRGVQS